MKTRLLKVLEKFKKDFKKVKQVEQLEAIYKEYTGKDSDLNAILKSMKDADLETKREVGKLANEVRNKISELYNKQTEQLIKEKLKVQLANEKIDVSLPVLKHNFGTKHPLNIIIDQISEIFTEIGFKVVSGTEVEQDLYNFQKLNLPKGHPARDMQDTFYINEDVVLRTHATNMTARMMTNLAAEKGTHVAAVSLGNVYRRDDDDATHSHQFMQMDAFAVGDNISFANLKWVLTYMLKRLFNENIKLRLRPSFFPFTEPSVEVDVSCFRCNGKGCQLCKYTSWIEVLGAGMLHEPVFHENDLDPNTMTGLAFGIGLERIAMLKFGITNIRDFYENDLEFLNQFKFYGK